MTKYIFLIIIILPSFCFSQSYSNDNKKFTYQNKIYEVLTINLNNIQVPVLKITMQNSTISEKIIPLTNITQDADLIYFSEFIDKTRKYIIIANRYSFQILNLYNDKVVGSFSPKFHGVGQDAQSGMISGLKIIMNGRFIIGYCVDSGVFLCDLTDLYQPKNVLSANNPYFHQNNVYILEDLDNPNKLFGLFVSTENWEADAKIIFTNKTIEFDDFSSFYQYSEVEIEDKMINYSLVDSKYTIIKEILPNSNYKFIVIDNDTGKFIILPNNIGKSSKQEVINYLNKLE